MCSALMAGDLITQDPRVNCRTTSSHRRSAYRPGGLRSAWSAPTRAVQTRCKEHPGGVVRVASSKSQDKEKARMGSEEQRMDRKARRTA